VGKEDKHTAFTADVLLAAGSGSLPLGAVQFGSEVRYSSLQQSFSHLRWPAGSGSGAARQWVASMELVRAFRASVGIVWSGSVRGMQGSRESGNA